MIKARGGKIVLFGLSRANTERLLADMPIRFAGEEVGLPGLVFVIIGGETEKAMRAQLQAIGAVTEDTVNDDRFDKGTTGGHSKG